MPVPPDNLKTPFCVVPLEAGAPLAPKTDNFKLGLVVPIPTLPDGKIVTALE